MSLEHVASIEHFPGGTRTTYKLSPAGRLTRAQGTALVRIERIVREGLAYQKVTEYTIGDPFADGTVPVSYAVESTARPGTLLHALDGHRWLFFVGPRGGVSVEMGPRSWAQFKGKRAFGLNVSSRFCG